MKNQIFTIATVLVTFTSVYAENGGTKAGTKNNSAIAVNAIQDVAAPESICENEKTTEATISEDQMITETVIEAEAPLNPGKSFDAIVNENNQIIESATAKEASLDFKKINQKKAFLKIKNNKRLIGSL